MCVAIIASGVIPNDAKGFVAPADFFDWCELEGIDTNYLRLLREIAGLSSGRQIGEIPLKGLTRYEFDSSY